jgi:hypothetical protein
LARLLDFKFSLAVADKKGREKFMAVHVICPSLKCRKILTLGDEVRGTLVTCRYCNMEFRVPQLKRTPVAAAPSMQPAKIIR